MNYVGVDIHKKYSVLCAVDERGRKLREARIEGNSGCGFAQFFASLEGPSKAVVEACWNWGLVHDELEEIEQVEEVVLAHPYKTRLIADAQIKTDRLDACFRDAAAGQPSGARPCAAPRDASAQKSAAAAALLGATSHHVAQPYPCAVGSTARLGVAAMLGHLRRARVKLFAPAGIARNRCRPIARAAGFA